MDVLLVFFAFFGGIIAGAMWMATHHSCQKAKNDATDEANAAEMHEIRRSVYWISNAYSLDNQIRSICDNNADKVKLIALKFSKEPYAHNPFYCKYQSFGNKWRIDIQMQNDIATPIVALVENHVW